MRHGEGGGWCVLVRQQALGGVRPLPGVVVAWPASLFHALFLNPGPPLPASPLPRRSTLWRYLFGRQARDLEQSNTAEDEYMISDTGARFFPLIHGCLRLLLACFCLRIPCPKGTAQQQRTRTSKLLPPPLTLLRARPPFPQRPHALSYHAQTCL